MRYQATFWITGQRLVAGIAAAAAIGLAATTSTAHETDQFTLPYGREFADLGGLLTRWAYERIEIGVNRINQKIARCLESNRSASDLASLQEPDAIVSAVNSAFPNAYDVIEGFESQLRSKALRDEFPGLVIGHKEQFGNIYQHVHFPLDPRQFFRIWHASTLKAFDVYFGTDKLGHFTDMGMHYYRAYSAAKKKGLSEDAAVAEAVAVGTHGPLFSERGMVGYLSAGAYSNADLVANYLGFLFYKNLTQPVMLKSELRPPMLERDGEFWRIAPHVRPDSDFFSYFISDHLNEALNPSHFESGMRSAVRQAIRARTEIVLARYCDAHSNRRPRQYFINKAEELRTYYGQEYGYEGPPDEMITIADACFDTFSPDAPVDLRDGCGNTPLHEAAANGDLDRVRSLLARGADVNATVQSKESYSSEWGNTPLHYAARDGRIEIAQQLIASGANVNAANARGITPLHLAVNHPELVQLLIQQGAALEARDNRGMTPLHWAAWDDSVPSVRMLLQHGAKPDVRDNAGETPLHRAAREGCAEATAALLAGGAAVNARSTSGVVPLHLAAARGYVDVITVLFTAKPDVNARDEFGWTALHDAARRGCEQTASLLLSRGASDSLVDINGNTPLHIAARTGHEPVAALLASRGASINTANNAGMTPLHEASAAGHLATVKALLQNGADRQARNTKGWTPSQIASSKGYRELAVLLRDSNTAVAEADH